MFKKIVSIAIAAMMVASTAAIAASAAETDSAAVAAAEDSAAVAAPDGDSVGADDSGSSAVGGNSISFKADHSIWKNYKYVMLYLYEHNGDEIIPWASKSKGKMDDAGNDIWTFDFDKHGISLESGKQYGVIFVNDNNVQTCDLITDSGCYGKTAVMNGEMIENTVDSNKKSYVVNWEGMDTSKYGPPLAITSIGNVVGSALWAGTTQYDLFLDFLKDTNAKAGITNALNFNHKSVQQTIDDTAKALGLGQDDIERAIKESGKTFDWKKEASSAQEGSSSGGDSSSSDSSSNSGSSSGSSSGGSSSSSSGSSSSGSSSVSSGQETTIFFVFGGVMLAAAGVIFLARKRRDF
jgi:LPXTG-motif cell wall-anchored protein